MITTLTVAVSQDTQDGTLSLKEVQQTERWLLGKGAKEHYRIHNNMLNISISLTLH